MIHSREEDAHRLRDTLSGARAELDGLIQGAVERVFRALDLPRRSDIEALSENLERVAKALERLEGRPQAARDDEGAPSRVGSA